MNPTTEPPQPPQPHRPSTSCDRHPEEHFTGFCPSCLCERLAVLDPNTSSAASSSSSRKPTATAALKAIFKPPQPSSSNNNNNSSKSSFFPELRRTKSFSASKNEGFSGVFEPQRKSCDVRVRNTLWSLFNQDSERNPSVKKEPFKGGPEIEAVEPRISCSSVRGPVFESKEEEEIENETDTENENVNANVNANIGGDVLANGVLEESNLTARNSNANPIDEIIEEEEEEGEEEDDFEDDDEGIVIEPEPVQEAVLEELKTMKDHIDLDSQSKKTSGRDFKEIAGSFWSAASVFSKKLQKWRQKQKLKKQRNDCPGSATLPVEKPIGRQYRETQSEIADYGFGRRSCDTDPRFSLDAGRISFDDPRYSFDEPRASWDGYLIGRTFPRMPTMVSVVEDAPVNVVLRSDTQIPVEEPPRISMNSINEDEAVPGGSAQTRDYYSDSSSRRRKSLDRSNSIRKTAAAVVAEIDELKAVSNAKVTPATADYIHGPKLVVPDRDFRDSNSNSLRDDCSETFDMGFRDNASLVGGNGERKGAKKPRRWSKAWNIWGFIHRRSVNKEDDDDRYSRANGVERSFSESWPELRGERNGDVRGGFNPKILRSNSSVSWRNSHNFGGGGSFSSARKSSVETNGNGRKKRDEFVLERNRSARYSPNNMENGLLRFYLTPLRNSRRNGWGKSKSSQAQSIARSVLRLY
ncbi:protein OCTOPUS-like [Populus nigra]|uniref:protein OCTOPUS-like n=1 Tax=Populus nigra TaxID=3691 RepID=UPI002B270730|nr:protein OCTOPUS-like [Populus nigra]